MNNQLKVMKDNMTILATVVLISVSMLFAGFTSSHELVQRETVTEHIAIQTIRQEDNTMPKGMEQLVQSGTEGSKTVIKESVQLDGKVLREDVIKVLSEIPMQPRIIKVGTRDNLVSTEQGHLPYSKKVQMEATAYLATDGGGDGITATGVMAERGIVAVDPNVIPLGSKVFIPGYGVALAADTGGAIIGNRIDLVMDTYGEAINFGRRNIDVYLLDS